MYTEMCGQPLVSPESSHAFTESCISRNFDSKRFIMFFRWNPATLLGSRLSLGGLIWGQMRMQDVARPAADRRQTWGKSGVSDAVFPVLGLAVGQLLVEYKGVFFFLSRYRRMCFEGMQTPPRVQAGTRLATVFAFGASSGVAAARRTQPTSVATAVGCLLRRRQIGLRTARETDNARQMSPSACRVA
jgi:hypothetical protein